MNRWIVSVDGIDGSGKSYMGRRIVDACAAAGQSATMLRVDDFRRPVAWGRGAKPDADRYYENYYDMAALDRCLADFLAGVRAITIPTYDSVAETITGSIELNLSGVDVVVVEGVFTLRMPAVAGAQLVWLDTSFDVATDRILTRDMPKGRTRENVIRRIESRYFPAHRRYLAEHDPRARAVLVVDNDDYRAPRVKRVAEDAADVLVSYYRSADAI